jgi:hypothetical protein
MRKQSSIHVLGEYTKLVPRETRRVKTTTFSWTGQGFAQIQESNSTEQPTKLQMLGTQVNQYDLSLLAIQRRAI